jgi:hypothetical protein
VRRPGQVGHVIDVHRVDADDGGPECGKQFGRLRREIRMARIRVLDGAPVPVPAGVHENRPAGDQIPVRGQVRRADSSAFGTDHDPVQIHQARQRHSGQVGAVAEAMERCVQVRPGVRDHRDASDLELRARRVPAAGVGARQMVGDLRTRQPRIGGHPGHDDVAEIDDPGLTAHCVRFGPHR